MRSAGFCSVRKMAVNEIDSIAILRAVSMKAMSATKFSATMDAPPEQGDAPVMPPVPPPLSAPEIEDVVDGYKLQMTRYEEAALLIERRLQRELRAEAIRCLLSSRAKHPDELREKIKLNNRKRDPRYVVAALGKDVGKIVTDLAGVRVLVYQADDVDKVRRVVRTQLRLAPCPRNDEFHDRPSGYWAAHLIVEVSDDERASLRGTYCEVQVTTVAAHVFNELEHDITYKTHGVDCGVAEEKTLRDVKAAARLLDRAAERLLAEHGKTVMDTQREIVDASQVQFIFEQRVGRKLSGDFERLFRFVRSSIARLTAETIKTLGEPPQLLQRGEEIAASEGWNDADDVARIVMGLYASYEAELESFIRGPGRPGSFKRAVEVARNAKVRR